MAGTNPNQGIIDSVPGRYHQAEYEDILSKFDLVVISQLRDEDFIDFGIMDSKKYAAKLLRLMEQFGLNNEEFTMAVVLATAVKSRKRILTAMKKFQGMGWYRAVLDFYNRATVQYSFEESETSISIVHFSSSLPFLAARIWLQITQEPTVETFLHNLWAAQIYLSEDLMREQKAWEAGFWENTVTKGGEKFEGGKDKGKFNEDYWLTKSKDYYLLLNADGSLFSRDPRTLAYEMAYTRDDLKAWIATRSTPAPRAVRQPQGGGGGGPGGPGGPRRGGPPGRGGAPGPGDRRGPNDGAVGGAIDEAEALLKKQPGGDDQEEQDGQQQGHQRPQQQPQQRVEQVQKKAPALIDDPPVHVPGPGGLQHLGSPSSGGVDQGAAGGVPAGVGLLAKMDLEQIGKAATDPRLAFLFEAADDEEKDMMAGMTEDQLRDRKAKIVDSVVQAEVARRLMAGPNANMENLTFTSEADDDSDTKDIVED